LRDERYAGTFIGGKVEMGELGTGKRIYKPREEWIRIPDAHPAIISQEIWDCAAAQKGKNTGQHGKQNTERILFKKVRCGYCGHVMKYNVGVSENYYRCKTARYSGEYGCLPQSYDEHIIVDAVKKVVQSHAAIMLDLEKLAKTLKKVSSTSPTATTEIGNEIEQLQASKRQLYERYKKGSLDKATYFKEREAVENAIEAKTAKREDLTSRNIVQSNALNAAHQFFETFSEFQADTEPTAKMVNTLVDYVQVFDIDRIEICFSFADKLENALNALNHKL
jgi:hypothetical protein